MYLNVLEFYTSILFLILCLIILYNICKHNKILSIVTIFLTGCIISLGIIIPKDIIIFESEVLTVIILFIIIGLIYIIRLYLILNNYIKIEEFRVVVYYKFLIFSSITILLNLFIQINYRIISIIFTIFFFFFIVMLAIFRDNFYINNFITLLKDGSNNFYKYLFSRDYCYYFFSLIKTRIHFNIIEGLFLLLLFLILPYNISIPLIMLLAFWIEREIGTLFSYYKVITNLFSVDIRSNQEFTDSFNKFIEDRINLCEFDGNGGSNEDDSLNKTFKHAFEASLDKEKKLKVAYHLGSFVSVKYTHDITTAATKCADVTAFIEMEQTTYNNLIIENQVKYANIKNSINELISECKIQRKIYNTTYDVDVKESINLMKLEITHLRNLLSHVNNDMLKIVELQSNNVINVQKNITNTLVDSNPGIIRSATSTIARSMPSGIVNNRRVTSMAAVAGAAALFGLAAGAAGVTFIKSKDDSIDID